jgi:hypothetical protein
VKINLVLQSGPTVLDYQNVSTKELPKIIDSICDEILVDSTLEYVNNDYFPLLVKKLRYGGNLTLVGTDLNSAIKAYEVGNLSIDEFNMLVAGGRMGIQPLTQVLEKLKNVGLTVLEIKYHDMKYYIKATRPIRAIPANG